jgi:hypothetical protein
MTKPTRLQIFDPANEPRSTRPERVLTVGSGMKSRTFANVNAGVTEFTIGESRSVKSQSGDRNIVLALSGTRAPESTGEQFDFNLVLTPQGGGKSISVPMTFAKGKEEAAGTQQVPVGVYNFRFERAKVENRRATTSGPGVVSYEPIPELTARRLANPSDRQARAA